MTRRVMGSRISGPLGTLWGLPRRSEDGSWVAATKQNETVPVVGMINMNIGVGTLTDTTTVWSLI